MIFLIKSICRKSFESRLVSYNNEEQKFPHSLGLLQSSDLIHVSHFLPSCSCHSETSIIVMYFQSRIYKDLCKYNLLDQPQAMGEFREFTFLVLFVVTHFSLISPGHKNATLKVTFP